MPGMETGIRQGFAGSRKFLGMGARLPEST
jgi:hypothetical protein